MYCDTPAGLKAHMPGAMLEIVATDARRVGELIRTLPGVLGSLLIGVCVHVHVDRAERRSDIAAALIAANIVATSIEEVTPTIEDLFVALLEQGHSKESA